LLGGGRHLKKFLESLLEEKAPGPYPSFSILHIIKALELITKTQQLGRGRLSEELRIGEGATRTLVERLKDADLVSTSRKGCSLTVKGEKVWSEFQSTFPQKIKLTENKLTSAECNVAVQVSGGGNRVRAGLEQRDAAMIAGARGAITIIFKKQKLFIPTISEDLSRDFPDAFGQITELLKLKENDAVVVGNADNWNQAEYGALAAAWTLINNNGVQ
jgi:predicted transcriptional regulator